MGTEKLHIVAFDVPWPADYGGVIDVFHKLRSLQKAGVSVHLHCFQYGRAESPYLDQFADKVSYYPRHRNPLQLLSSSPFIVSTRQHPRLLKSLIEDDAPILFEGLHCTSFMGAKELKDRKKIFRAHNIEHDYYLALSESENKPLKRLYLRTEARKLRKYEQVCSSAAIIAAISENDQRYFQSKYGHAHLLPAFHAFDHVRIATGTGSFHLYHGNLAVAENEQAALWLVTEIAPSLNHKLLIAGQGASPRLRKAIQSSGNTLLIDAPSQEELYRLMQDAHCHLLPTFQPTGMKLKLLHALFTGRHIVANQTMLTDSDTYSVCHIANDAVSFIRLVNELSEHDFTVSDIQTRERVVMESYSNQKSAQKILSWLRS